MKRLCLIPLAIMLLALSAWPVNALADKHTEPVPSETEISTMAPLARVIERNWQTWSKGSGTVSKLDLIAHMANPAYKGEDAAALVALEKWLRKAGSIDRENAIALQDPKIISTYYSNVHKLKKVKRLLFANGQPTFELLQQGPPGDCYFFSGTGWMAFYRKQVIMDSIKQRPDGRYDVIFPNGDSAIVDPPTDAELAINDSTSTLQDGLWMSVLEKATGMILSRTSSKSADIPDYTVAIDRGGVPIGSIVERWTGKKPILVHLGSRTNRDKVRKALIHMQRYNLMSEALLLRKPPAKLAYNHVYAILGFDDTTDMVKIWNPWGTDFKPKGPSGAEFGYARDKGVFFLPLADFIDFYSVVAIEKR